MPKKQFEYKNFIYTNDIWYTDKLKGWFIVKEDSLYTLRKGSIINKTTLELGSKRYKTYQRLGDAKVGLETYNKQYIQSLKNQEALFNELQKNQIGVKKDSLDYSSLDKEVERLKQKWGITK